MTWTGDPRTSTTEWRRLRQQVFATFGRRCYLCGQPANRVDHVKPVAEGGTDTVDNLRPICLPCDKAKSSNEGHRARARQRSARNRPAEQHPGLR